MDDYYSRFSREDLDRLYSPSRFSSRLSAHVIVQRHIDVFSQETTVARKILQCELGVKFDTPDGPTLDIYYPPNPPKKQSIFIYLHGGYWQALGLEHSGFMALSFSKQGIITVAIGYDLAPQANMTTIVDQCRKACAYVVKRFEGSRIFVGGHSAGGHLTACMLASEWGRYGLETQCPFAGAVLVSGVFDLKPIQLCYVDEPLKLTDSEVEQFSPLRALPNPPPPKEIPCLLVVGSQESPEFKRQTVDYAEALTGVGVVCSRLEMEGEDHFSIIERLAEDDYQLTKVILRMMEDT